ncbi:MAG: hypothetical protein GXO09_01910 [Crenarchaeota archaeon]|nr:hypothetical protein [Thermoproteota archaeon]
MAKPDKEELLAIICTLYELCPSIHCHVAPETVRRATRLPGDRFSKAWRWLIRRGLIWCKSHGHRESCGPSRSLLKAARRHCPELWSSLE